MPPDPARAAQGPATLPAWLNVQGFMFSQGDTPYYHEEQVPVERNRLGIPYRGGFLPRRMCQLAPRGNSPGHQAAAPVALTNALLRKATRP